LSFPVRKVQRDSWLDFRPVFYVPIGVQVDALSK
jgi:hypothetical protein